MRADMPADMPCDLSVIVVNYNTRHLLRRDVRRARGGGRRTVAADRSSSTMPRRDGSADYEPCYLADVRADRQRPRTSASAAPTTRPCRWRAAACAAAEHRCVRRARQRRAARCATSTRIPMCGMLGVRLVGRDGSAAAVLPLFPDAVERVLLAVPGCRGLFRGTRLVDDMTLGSSHRLRECDWVPGCYCLVRRRSIDESACSIRVTSSTTRRSITAAP